jgi:hypothetical protein
MYSEEFFRRLKIGLSICVGFVAGKLAADSSPPHYSLLFSSNAQILTRK